MKPVVKLFAGRTVESEILTDLLKNNRAELVAIIGRRRVGKTYLVKQVFSGQMNFHFTGIKDADRNTLLTEFSEKIISFAPKKFSATAPQNWMEAFRLLKKYLLTIKGKKKKIVF